MKSSPKKTDQINIRGSDADLGAFRRLCEESGFEASEIIRDLMRAALAYIPACCAGKRWYPPRLIPDTPTMAADYPPAAPINVRNGNGHCHVRIDKKFIR